MYNLSTQLKTLQLIWYYMVTPKSGEQQLPDILNHELLSSFQCRLLLHVHYSVFCFLFLLSDMHWANYLISLFMMMPRSFSLIADKSFHSCQYVQENPVTQSSAETQSNRHSFAWCISIAKIISLSFQKFSSASLPVSSANV